MILIKLLLNQINIKEMLIYLLYLNQNLFYIKWEFNYFI